MKTNLVADFLALPSRVKIAGALTFGALALVALDAGLTSMSPRDPPRPEPTRPEPTRIATPTPDGLRNLAYYPEQLAALTSMADFEPRADSGVAVIPAAEPPAPAAPKPIRHVAAQAPASVPPPTDSAAQNGESPVKILGLAIPQGSAIGARIVAVRDSASHLGEAARDLGGPIATFGR